MIKFSIIMPSFLGAYEHAAKDRELKIKRAIESVISQTHQDWELIIISDGCKKTIEIVMDHVEQFQYPYDIKMLQVRKQPRWSGIRNFGLDRAQGDYIVYLDVDDMFAPDYLQNIAAEIIDDQDWYFTDDYQIIGSAFQRITSNINKIGKCGTSNIIHRATMKARWLHSDYTEDWQFIKQLKTESARCRRIKSCGYYVCHIPGHYDY